jgi:hypothetical protein
VAKPKSKRRHANKRRHLNSAQKQQQDFYEANRSQDLPGESRVPRHYEQNRHHLLNKCRGGTRMDENMVWMYIEKHNLFHKIFHNDDPEYIIMALDRLMDMKGYHRFRGIHVLYDTQ